MAHDLGQRDGAVLVESRLQLVVAVEVLVVLVVAFWEQAVKADGVVQALKLVGVLDGVVGAGAGEAGARRVELLVGERRDATAVGEREDLLEGTLLAALEVLLERVEEIGEVQRIRLLVLAVEN